MIIAAHEFNQMDLNDFFLLFMIRYKYNMLYCENVMVTFMIY